MARTRPQEAPATNASPTSSVPRMTSTVTTGPRPGSRRDSITTPLASASGLAEASAWCRVRSTASVTTAESAVCSCDRWAAEAASATTVATAGGVKRTTLPSVLRRCVVRTYMTTSSTPNAYTQATNT